MGGESGQVLEWWLQRIEETLDLDSTD
jgi:hypothetical protein